jgi:hypothetical protein
MQYAKLELQQVDKMRWRDPFELLLMFFPSVLQQLSEQRLLFLDSSVW